MKNELMGSLIKGFVRDEGFTPLADENGNISINEGINVLIKDSYGSLVIMELLDADMMRMEDIEARLKANKERLENINGPTSSYILEVFLFEGRLEEDKLKIIVDEQYQSMKGRRFLKCLSVDCTAKSVTKHFKLPATDFGIKRFIESQLKNGLIQGTNIEEIGEILAERSKELQIEFKAKTPILTYALIAINIAVFALIYLYGLMTGTEYGNLLITFGAKENSRIIAGEYWRLIAPIFLHADIVHLFVNCYSLYAVGVTVEKIFGHSRFAFVYFVAGIIGNIASFMFSINPGVGASGAIFGLLGAMLYFGLEKPNQFKAYFGYGIITTIIINLVYGFSNKGIDNFAHMGGLLGGFLGSGIVGMTKKDKWYFNKGLFLILTVVLTASGLFYGFHNKQNQLYTKVVQLEELEKNQKWKDTEKLGEDILASDPNNKDIKRQALWSLTTAEIYTNKYDEGMQHAKELATLDPINGHYLQGVIYIQTGSYEIAKKELLEAKKLGADENVINGWIIEADNRMSK